MAIDFYSLLIKGIDVSQFNGDIDWSLVSNVDIVAVRVGWGRVIDRQFAKNWTGAKKFVRPAYWYMDYYSNRDETSTAFGISDANWGKIQAEKYWSAVQHDAPPLVFLDIERYSGAEPLEDVREHVLTVAESFLKRVDELSGKYSGLYLALGQLSFFPEWFRDRPLWLAWYNELQTPESVLKAVKDRGWKGKCLMWQYARHGDMNGDGKADGKTLGMEMDALDLNMWLGTRAELYDWSKKMTNILLNIPPLSQVDPRWSGNKLGTSNSTIGGYGCLITSISMMLTYFGFPTDPGNLNQLLKSNGGYHDNNLFVWGVTKKIYPPVTHAYRYERAALDKIDEQLENGRPAVVNVDFVPATSYRDEHWVLVVGRVDGSYIINDPKDGKQLKFEDRYGDPKKGMFIVCTYNYVPPAVTEKPLYQVKVKSTVVLGLVIRSEPVQKTSTDTKLRARKDEVYTVYEEKNGYVRIGKDMWISADYVSKISEPVTSEPTVTDCEKLAILWDWYKSVKA